MLVVNRFVVPTQPDGAAAFTRRAGDALAALAVRPGYRSGRLCRAYDDPTHWSLVTEWESVGAYRRALSAYEVKVAATPLLACARDEPSAYEELAGAAPGGPVTVFDSDLAPDGAPDGPAPERGYGGAAGG